MIRGTGTYVCTMGNGADCATCGVSGDAAVLQGYSHKHMHTCTLVFIHTYAYIHTVTSPKKSQVKKYVLDNVGFLQVVALVGNLRS